MQPLSQLQARPKMSAYRYPNLTIIDESDIIRLGPSPLDNAIIAKCPQNTFNLSPQSIQDAIQDQFQVHIEEHQISYYGPDFLLQPPSSIDATLMLTKPFVHVGQTTLILIPWTTDYGSTKVPFHTQESNIETINFDAIAWHVRNPQTPPPPPQNVEIQILGIPPHLCSDPIIHDLLDQYCTIKKICFFHSDITYWVSAHTTDLLRIPSVAHIAVKKNSPHGTTLDIWPLWYNMVTEEMNPNQNPHNYSETSAHQRGIKS